MSDDCNLCQLLRIESPDDWEIDDGIKADARRQLFQVEGSGLTVDDFMGYVSSEDKIEPKETRQRQFPRVYEPFRDYCNEILRNHTDDKVQCRLCGKNLTVRKKKQLIYPQSLIDHASRHLGKPIFACAHCDNEFTSRSVISQHLRKEHRLITHPSHFIDSSARYEQEILEMLQRCYGITGSEPLISGVTTKIRTFRQNSRPLSNFSRKLLNLNKDGKIPCSICGRVLVVYGTGSHNFVNHAQIHLGKPLFKCDQCDLQFCTKAAVQSHLGKVHALSFSSKNYTDMSSSYEKDMKDILERCFGQQNLVKSEPSEEPKAKLCSHRHLKDPISNACRSLFANLPLDAIVRCSLCGNEKKLHQSYPTPTIASIHFVSHALLHLAKPMFKCRLCDRSTLTQRAMYGHLSSVHKVASSKANFVDDSSKHQKEIIAMLEKCYDQSHTDGQVSDVAKRSTGTGCPQALILAQAGTDTLLAERNIRCYELTRKFQKSGKVKCRVCRLELLSTTGMLHVVAHLNKVIYRCRLCSQSSKSCNNIRDHVRLTHGLSSRNHFEDRSNNFHAQILELISDCFDWDKESSNGHAMDDHEPRNACRLIGRSRGNDLKAARLLHCQRLAQKFAQDGCVSCRICSTSVMVVSGFIKGKQQQYSSRLLNHATRHLKKVHRFGCKLCSKTARSRTTMSKHLKRVHNSSGTADFEDRLDIYHPKIMKILTKCFDWSENCR